MKTAAYILYLLYLLEKLVYFTILPNFPVAAFNEGNLGVVGLATFFLVHTITLRSVPAYGGYLTDLWSARTVMALGYAIEFLGYLLLVQATRFSDFIFFGVLIGFGGGLYAAAIQGALAKMSAKTKDRRPMELSYLFLNVGAFAGPIWIFPQLGKMSVYLALLPIVLLAALPFIRANFLDAVPKKARAKNFISSLKALVTDKNCTRVFFLLALFWSAYTMIFSSIPVIAKEIGNPFKGNFALAINAGVIVFCHFWITKITGKVQSLLKIIVFGAWLGGLSIIGVALAQSMPALIIGIVFLSLGELVFTPNAFNYLNEIARDSMRAQYVSVMWVAGAVGEGGGHGALSLFPNARAVCIGIGVLLILSAIVLQRSKSLKSL